MPERDAPGSLFAGLHVMQQLRVLSFCVGVACSGVTMGKLKDKDSMPFGKYKGSRMIEVPPHYLMWLLGRGLRDGNVKSYIMDNYEALEKESTERRNEYAQLNESHRTQKKNNRW